MLGIFIALLACTKSILYFILATSLFVGKAIFDLLSIVFIKSSTIFTSVLTGVQILLEDFGLFLHDLAEHAGFGMHIIHRCLENILSIFTIIYNPIASTFQWSFNTVNDLFAWISNSYNNILALIGFLLTNSKKLLILFGSGVWFAVTIIPVGIFSASILFVYYLGVLLEELIIVRNNIWGKLMNGAKTTGEFFFDVPLEAILGLCFLACIVYVLYKFYQTVQDFVMSNLREVRNKIKFNIKLPRVLSEEPIEDVSAKSIDNEDSTVCVVCQIKPKNMLILPCKHLCACEDCMNQIRMYSGRCPLCRARMDRTIHVYM